MKAIAGGSALGVDLLTFPELAICGYLPEDLLLKPKFIQENIRPRQEPPGIKITSRAFGKDRRLPITNRFKGC